MRWAEKPIRYETHARHRMASRGISQEQAEYVIRSSKQKRPAKRPGAIRIEKRLSARRRLIVIVEEEDTFIRVITAYLQ
jgi:hypothetical protein